MNITLWTNVQELQQRCVIALWARIDVTHNDYKQARRQDLAAGGAKNQKGGHILKYGIGCMQQRGGQTWNWGAQISNGGLGTTGTPAGDGSDYKNVNQSET